MCGINGVIRLIDKLKAEKDVAAMNQTVKHRGPDDSGQFTDYFVSLGHRRLSIIDLSSAGHQPMFSKDESIVVVFNGEIYNFKDIRGQIGDYQFNTHTDTEVIIAAYLKWGISFIHHLDGMFAIALYDKKEEKVFLIRDRLGVKPIYYHQSAANEIYFSSEIRGIRAVDGFKGELDRESIYEYLTYQTVTSENTLVKGVKMLDAGTYAVISKTSFDIQTYWSPQYQTNNNLSYENTVKDVRELLFQAVEKRMMSDVPFGAFLSGGIDSSAIVAAMSECGVKPNTFNINFSEGEFSEAQYARLIAKKFNTNHTELNLKPEYFLSLLPAAVHALDHPSIDGLNTFIVSKATKEAGISVALSGVGGDEWFAGYPVFKRIHHNELSKFKAIPKFLRLPGSRILNALSKNEGWSKKLELLGSELNNSDLHKAERKLFTNDQIKSLLNKTNTRIVTKDSIKNISDLSIEEWKYYLMPILLRDTDQMGMAHSLEIREPFLDYKLVEYLLSVPDSFKFGPKPKQLLVSAMGNLLPDEIVSRPKMGFVLPYEIWMKNDLKPYVKEGLNILKNHELFNERGISGLEEKYFEKKNLVKWNMIWSLAVLGHWINNNKIE